MEENKKKKGNHLSFGNASWFNSIQQGEQSPGSSILDTILIVSATICVASLIGIIYYMFAS